jgi:CheY-like chemotaxis protein
MVGSFPQNYLDGIHVLVVDDDADTRELAVQALEHYGALVTTVPSATQAVKALERFLPDIVVSDLAMPGEDGYWLLREIRAMPGERARRIRVIAVTAFGSEHPRDRALNAGFDEYLRKPLDVWVLCAMIGRLCGRVR